LATRRSKFEAAKAAGASKEETVAAAFERVHGDLEKRLQPFKNLFGLGGYECEASPRSPACRRGAPPEDASAKLGKLESVKTKELEDLDVVEEDALDRSDPGRDGSCEAACDGNARARPWSLRGAKHREAIRRTPQGDRERLPA
jgi:hypothetical protein